MTLVSGFEWAHEDEGTVRCTNCGMLVAEGYQFEHHCPDGEFA